MQIEGAKCEFAEKPRKQEQRGLRDCGDGWPCSVGQELTVLPMESCGPLALGAAILYVSVQD